MKGTGTGTTSDILNEATAQVARGRGLQWGRRIHLCTRGDTGGGDIRVHGSRVEVAHDTIDWADPLATINRVLDLVEAQGALAQERHEEDVRQAEAQARDWLTRLGRLDPKRARALLRNIQP